MGRTLLQRLALFARHRYRAIFVGSAVLVGLSVLAATRLSFDPDVLNLLPQNEPVVRILRETLEDFGSVEYLLVVVRIPEGAAVDPYETFTGRLGEALRQLEILERVDYRLGEPEELLEDVLPRAVLFLDEEGRSELSARVTDEALRRRAKELRRLVATPQSLTLEPLIRLDPLGVSDLFLEGLGTGRGGLAVDWTSGYLLSRDHRLLLILAKPAEPPQDIEFDRRLVRAVEEKAAELGAAWGEIAGPHPPPPPEVELGGSYVIALGDASLIQRDVVVNALTSMVLVLLLFLLAFRRVGPLLYAFIPLFSGLALIFGFSALTYGVLSAATSGIAALLIGLGIDFVIVSYGRYAEERRRGRDLEGALAVMSGSSGRAVVVGAVTSAATFYSFGVTDFTGLRQMGFLTGTGILFCMVAVLLLLPAMLAWSEDHHRRRRRLPPLVLHGFGAARLIRASARHPLPVIAAGIAVTVGAGLMAFQLEFVDSVREMRPPENRGMRVQDEVVSRFGSGFDYMMLVVEGDSLPDVLQLADRAAAEARELIAARILNGVDGVTSLIPPPGRQAGALEWLEGVRQDRLDMDRIQRTFRAALAAEGLRFEPFRRGLELFSRAIAPPGPIRVQDLADSPRASRLLERYLQPADGGGWKSVVYLYPPGKVWKRRAPPQVVALADHLGPGVELTGGNVVSAFLRQRVKRDAVVAAVIGFFLVAGLLWLDFRCLEETLLSLAPLLVGIVWMLGAMGALGLAMNFMNIFVTTMIIGIGVDYGIHIIHRSRETGEQGGAEGALAETGKAIVLAALSTVIGFGSLSLSHYPGLRSMGLVAILGAVASCLVAITVLPAVLALREKA